MLYTKYPFLVSLRFWQQTLFLWQKNLYWIFQIKFMFGSVSEDSLVELENGVPWQFVMLYFLLFPLQLSVSCFLTIKSDQVTSRMRLLLILIWKVDKLNKWILFEVALHGFTKNTEYIINPYEQGYFNYLYLSIIFYAFSYVILHPMVVISVLTTSRHIIYLIFTFSLPVWDRQTPLWHDI